MQLSNETLSGSTRLSQRCLLRFTIRRSLFRRCQTDPAVPIETQSLGARHIHQSQLSTQDVYAAPSRRTRFAAEAAEWRCGRRTARPNGTRASVSDRIRCVSPSSPPALHAGVPLRDVQAAASHVWSVTCRPTIEYRTSSPNNDLDAVTIAP